MSLGKWRLGDTQQLSDSTQRVSLDRKGFTLSWAGEKRESKWSKVLWGLTAVYWGEPHWKVWSHLKCHLFLQISNSLG